MTAGYNLVRPSCRTVIKRMTWSIVAVTTFPENVVINNVFAFHDYFPRQNLVHKETKSIAINVEQDGKRNYINTFICVKPNLK